MARQRKNDAADAAAPTAPAVADPAAFDQGEFDRAVAHAQERKDAIEGTAGPNGNGGANVTAMNDPQERARVGAVADRMAKAREARQSGTPPADRPQFVKGVYMVVASHSARPTDAPKVLTEAKSLRRARSYIMGNAALLACMFDQVVIYKARALIQR